MNCKRIKTLQQLAEAARDGISVVGWDGRIGIPKPAAFVFNMAASVVHSRIVAGLYIYHQERKSKDQDVRNPEGIDFNLYPIPNGYTVANQIPDIVPDDWMTKVGSVWCKVGSGIIKGRRKNWTYLRPLRRGEKGARV